MKFASPVKNVLLGFICFLAFLAVPVQSQTLQTNPTSLAACGLPATYSRFTSAATMTTFNMTADCTYTSASVPNGNIMLSFDSGEFTINGNGYSIIGPPNSYLIRVRNTGTVLHLNNVTIRQNINTSSSGALYVVQAVAHVRNVVFQDNSGLGAILVSWNGQAYISDTQFLRNRNTGNIANTGSAVSVSPGGQLHSSFARITNAVFDGNAGNANSPSVIGVIGADDGTGVLELRGCIIFRNNVDVNGAAASEYRAYPYDDNGVIGGVVSDESNNKNDRSRCPQTKKKKDPTPVPTATTRPPAVTCPGMSQASGIVVHATFGLNSGVQCQRLDGGGIGIQALADSYIAAVDIWGYVEQGVEVCFPQAGRLLFLDASAMPRVAAPLASTVVNGMTCASITTPGSIVLMPN